MPPRAARSAQNGHAQQQNGHAPAADGPRMPPLRRSESSASDSSLPDLASASSSESESDHEGADPRPPRRAPPSNGAAPAVAVAPEPEPEPEPEPVAVPETKPGCRHGFMRLEDCETCQAIQQSEACPPELREKKRKDQEYRDQWRRARVVVAERALSERDQTLGKSTNSLAAAAKVARKALDELHFRSTANASERIGMDGDTEVTEILQRARDGTGKDKDGGVVNCALVFAAHYGLLDHVIDILKKCPPHVIPALLNCTASFYEPLASQPPISLVKGVVVSKDFHGEHANKVFWPMTSDKFVEDTPLVAAARRDNTEVLLALLHCGADPDAAAACGATALGVACVSGFADVAEVLLGHNLRYANAQGDPVGGIRPYFRTEEPYEKAADVTGDVYRCVRSLRLWDEAHGYAESLGPFESTMSDNKQYLVERRVPTKETALKLLIAHQDPGQCPAVYSGRWRADPDLPCTIEMKHVGLALARTSDQTQATAGQRVSGAPLELAVRSHSLNVIEVLLRAGAVVEGKVMDGTPLFKRVDKTCFSRARDDEIDTEYKADEPCHKFISEVLGAILSPEICRILRTLAGQGPNRLNFEKQRREELMYRLGCLMELGFCMGPDFRGNKREEKAERYGPEDGPKVSKKFAELTDEDITRQREALEKAIRACHLYAYELRGDSVNLASSARECEKARDMNKACSKNKELTGAEMAKTCLFLALARLARLAAKQLGTMTTPDGLRQGADYVQDLVEAAQKAKVSHGFPEKQLPQFDAEVLIWAKALLAKCDEARARADALPAGDDAVAIAEVARFYTAEAGFDKIMTSSELFRLGLCEGRAAGFIDADDARKQAREREACARDPDPKLYLSYYEKPCYGPDAERPAKGFDSVSAPPSPVIQPTPAPAPPRDDSLTAEQQRLNEALHAEDPEAKAAREAREAQEAAERQRVAARAEDERRRKKEAKDKAKREQQERQRAEDLKRKAKREREAARNRERDRRLALWDPARRACAKALQKDAETLTRALPWADLAAHYGVQEAADAQLLRDETPSLGAPNALNPKAQHDGCIYPVQEDEGLYASSQPLLVADRVRDWYGSRANPNWRKRLLEVLASLAKGSDGSWCRAAHPQYREFGVRIALLDDTMRLIWSATKASDGGLRCLAWCCVRTGSVDSTCEGIKQALDRRASDKGKLVESSEPYLTLDDDDVLIHPGKNRPMKLWSCRVDVLEKMAQGSPPEKWSPSLRLTTKEQAAVQEANAPAMVLGRSGTGKTHCIVARIARDSRQNPSEKLLFATRSRKLRKHVEEAVRAALLDDEGKAPSPQSVAKPTYLDATAKSTAEDSLLPFLEAQLKPLPASKPWHDRTPVRRRRFYRKDDVDDNERRTGVLYRSKRDAGEITVEDSSDDESDDEDSDEDVRRPQKATWDASKYVDFATFERWHREVCAVPSKPEPDTCWTQIKSFLKGSIGALFSGEPLTEQQYLSEAWGGRRTLGMDVGLRKRAYQVFKSYERYLEDQERWDACDREVALVQRALRDGFVARGVRSAPFDRAYVDEVQDMTQASLAVLLLAVGGDPERLYCCGDTAQAIQDGVAFRFQAVRKSRFQDLRQAIFELREKVATLSKQSGYLGARALKLENKSTQQNNAGAASKLRKLTKNYRAHAGVLGAANAVLDLVYHAFPTAVDKTDSDTGVALGPRPIFATYKEYLRDVDSRAVLLFRADALEAAQRLLSEEAEEVARRRAEVLRIADEESAAAGGVADAAQRYDQRRRDLSDAAEAHADAEMRNRKAQKKEYDDARREKEKRTKALAKRRKEWKDDERKLRTEAREALQRRATRDSRLVQRARSRRQQDEDAGRTRAAQEHQQAQKAAGAAAQKEYMETQQRAYQRAVDEHALLVQQADQDYQRAVAEHARRPPQVAGPPSVQELVRQFVGDRGSADALCATMEAEGVDAEVLTIMQPDDFGELGINASLARQLQDAARRPATVRPPPPPPQRPVVPPAPRKEDHANKEDMKAAVRRAKNSVERLAAFEARHAPKPLEAYIEDERARPTSEVEVDEARAALPPTPTEEEAIQNVPDDQPAVVLPPPPLPHSKQERQLVIDAYLDEQCKSITDEVPLSEIKKHKKMVRDRRKKAKKGQSTEDDVDEAQKAIRASALKKLREEIKKDRRDKLKDVSGAFECANMIENEEYGSRAFSVQEFKGLERDAVVLVDFFGSARDEKMRGWRDLLRAARGDGLQGINHKVGENRALERDLKVLYTALTRCRSKLVVLETDVVGASKDASKFFLQAAEQGRSALAEKAAPRVGGSDSDEDGETVRPVSGDEWRSRGALNARVAAEAADDPMAPPTQAKARLAQAKTCFANAQDADLKARCDVSTECLVELRSIRALLELASDKSGDERLRYTKDAESKASAMVKRAVEALAIDDALRVLKLFPEDEVIKGAVEKVEAVRDKALKEASEV